ncbi:MAG: hypothetical protein COB60_07350 [Flavobacteriaceae bacterium]|nr:MAG: hypothetical protein COB60_07350 [Flavobacteriaceae bacterium]
MKQFFLIVQLSLFFVLLGVKANAQLQTKLFISLPDYCPIPDNLAVAPDGTLTLTCPNFKGGKEGVIVSITADKKVTKLAQLQGREKGLVGKPMGLDYAPDGSLFVCNNQGKGQGQVLRLTFKDGVVDSTQVVATGISPNGLKYSNGYVYVTQPRMRKLSKKSVIGGVYRFKESDRNVLVSGKKNDPYLIFTAETTNPQRKAGLDGLTFDKEGNLYVGEFGDATIYKLTINDKGIVTNDEVYVQLPQNTGVDGMIMDENNNLYVVGFSLNQLIKVDANKNVKILAEYPDNDGSNGELDQPVDLCFFNGKLLISNFDSMVAPGMVNKSHSKPYTISYIDLNKLN